MIALQAVLLSATVACTVAVLALCRRYANRALSAAGRATRAALAAQDALAGGRDAARDAPTATDARTETIPRLDPVDPRPVDPPEVDMPLVQTPAQQYRADRSAKHRRSDR